MMLKGERDARCSSFCCNTIPYNIFFACKYITFISLSNDTYQHQRTLGVLSTNLWTLGTFKTRDQSSNIFRIVHYTDKSVNFVNTAIFFLHSLKICLWRLLGGWVQILEPLERSKHVWYSIMSIYIEISTEFVVGDLVFRYNFALKNG